MIEKTWCPRCQEYVFSRIEKIPKGGIILIQEYCLVCGLLLQKYPIDIPKVNGK